MAVPQSSRGQKSVAITVPTDAVPIDVLRRYSSPRPIRQATTITRTEFLDALTKVSRRQQPPADTATEPEKPKE
jgi:hypothetical protein